MAVAKGRTQINYHLRNGHREMLEQIHAHHLDRGRSHMSRTLIIETLIEREFRRLKLCSDAATSPS